MKTRVITGVVAGAFAVLVLCLMNTVFFPIVLSIFCAVAVYEVEKTAGLKNIPIMLITLIVAAFIPFYFHFHLNHTFTYEVYVTFIVAYVITVLVLMLLFFDKTRFEQVAISLIVSLAIPTSISVLILLRDIAQSYPRYTAKEGLFLILFALFSSWLTDTFAFFAGSKLGKHKLCPEISPKKTVEGAIGGIVGETVMNLVLLFIFNRFIFDGDVHVTYLGVGLLSILLSVISMCGDLSASTIKRNYGVKDFGNLFPGHGGVMDRFDSVVFVLPVLYAFVICLA